MDLKRCVTRVGAGKWYYRVLEQTQVSPALARVNGELCSRHGEKLSVTRVGAGSLLYGISEVEAKKVSPAWARVNGEYLTCVLAANRCHPRGRG